MFADCQHSRRLANRPEQTFLLASKFAVCKQSGMAHTLRKFIEISNTSQAKFAAAVGISRGYMSQLVGGSKTPSLDVAFAIERATGGAVPASSWVDAGTRKEASA